MSWTAFKSMAGFELIMYGRFSGDLYTLPSIVP
jgi:hypothetical protein